jgi:energy-coupling factor transporter ATP-binding protein EcfA2
MLVLTLKNFRKFETAEFIFDQQLSLISGKSGQGKTTIFMAIVFALTGEGKKLPSYGKTSCSVTLIISEDKSTVTIVRTRRPNRLMVTIGDGKMVEDMEAQAVIDELFPQYHMGYMSQRTDSCKSFILMTPMDKMRYIEKMAFGGENVNQLISNCKDLVKGRKTEMMLTTRQRETTEKMLKDLKIDKVDCKDFMDEEAYDDKISQYEREVDSLKSKLIKTENLIKMKEELNLQLIKMPCIEEDDFDHIDRELRRIDTHKQGWERYQREKAKLNKLNVSSGMSKNEINSMIQDMKVIIDLESEVDNINKCRAKIDKINKQIDDSMVHMSCPSCETEVAMWCNKLIIPSAKGVKTNNAITTEESKRLEERRVKAILRIDELEKKSVDLEKMRVDYPDIKDAHGQLKDLIRMKRDDEIYASQNALCSSLKVVCPDYDDTTEATLRKKKKAMYERKEKEDMLARIIIKHDPDDLKECIGVLVDLIKKLNIEKRYVQSIKYWNKVESLRNLENDLNISYPRAIKLQEIIKKAEKMAVREVIDEINLHAQMYIDNFLDDMNVTLVFDGVKLNVEVLQGGHDSDLQNLSGGELARVILAFTIALAEINNVKLLLLDECVASLDQESTGLVIDTIKDNFKGMVICIAHQTTTGIFDHVLEL